MADSLNDKWPTGVQFSMAPFGYTVTVDRLSTQGNTVKYGCRYECCQLDFMFPVDSSVESAIEQIGKHVYASH